MDIRDFKSGNYIQQFQYKSFHPEKINVQWIVGDPKVNKLLEEANIKLGNLNAFSMIVPDVDLFIRMHIIKEATTSSRIEGTQTHIQEAAMKEDEVEPEKKNDWQEVQNYIKATNAAIQNLSTLPISTRLIKLAHKILMDNVRGESKLPGEYRRSQNWLGGASIKDAAFVPPHHTELPELLGDLENFLNNNDFDIPHLIKIAIAHYQFETIHPFLDGNGRVGRLLITLYLTANNILSKPTLYLSDFFEKHRQLYYDNLTVARANNDLRQWILFFLTGIIETCDNAIKTFSGILQLKNEIEDSKLPAFGKNIAMAKQFLYYLYSYPTIAANDIITEFSISKQTANTLIKKFETLNILKEKSGRKRNKMYVFEDYLNLFIR